MLNRKDETKTQLLGKLKGQPGPGGDHFDSTACLEHALPLLSESPQAPQTLSIREQTEGHPLWTQSLGAGPALGLFKGTQQAK